LYHMSMMILTQTGVAAVDAVDAVSIVAAVCMVANGESSIVINQEPKCLHNLPPMTLVYSVY
jgi:hypothetical protein